MVSMLNSSAEGHRFDPQPGQTKDIRNRYKNESIIQKSPYIRHVKHLGSVRKSTLYNCYFNNYLDHTDRLFGHVVTCIDYKG